jgi:hypothetical protein
MKYRDLKLVDDYSELAKLWEKSPMGVAPIENMLSPFGVVAYDSTGIHGAIFNFYINSTRLVLIGYPIVDFDLPKEERNMIFPSLLEAAEKDAYGSFCNLAQSYSGNPHMTERMMKEGWIIGDAQVTHLMKKL